MFLVVSLAAIAASSSPCVGTTACRNAHAAVLETLRHGGSGGAPLSFDDPRAGAAIAQGWAVLAEWLAAALEARPAATARELHESLSRGSAEAPGFALRASTLRLDPDTLLVTAEYVSDDGGAAGTFFVVARTPNGFRPAWSVRDAATRHPAFRDELSRWTFLAGPSYGDGPLVGSAQLLPPARTGAPRFFVDATSVGDGGTRPGQLSVWEWSGSEAVPLVIGGYLASDATPAARFHGGILRVPTKEPTGTIYSCGQCPEPRGRWTIRVDRDGVDDRGHAWRVPELRVVDDLFTRLGRGEPARDLAAASVIDRLTELLRDEFHGEFSFGMLEHFRRSRRGSTTRLDLVCDDASFRFRLERRGAGWFVTSVAMPAGR